MGVDLRSWHFYGDRHRGRTTHSHTSRRVLVPRRPAHPRLRKNGKSMPDNAVIPIVRVAVLATAGGSGRMTELALYTVSGVAAATVIAALLSRIRSPWLATALAMTGLLPVAAAFLLAVPGELGPAQILLAAAGVTAWSIVSITIEERAMAVFTAAAVTGFGVLLAAAAATLWELPIATLGCGVVLFALLVTVQAAQLSALWARFPLPVIP